MLIVAKLLFYFYFVHSSFCAYFIRIHEESYKLKSIQYKVITLDRIFSDFASAETSTSGDSKILFLGVKGLLVSLGHFNLYCLTREAHFHHVASRHAY